MCNHDWEYTASGTFECMICGIEEGPDNNEDD